MSAKRRNHYDITDRVHIANPRAVCEAAVRILGDLYPTADLQPLRHAFDTFGKLYAGTLPGYVGCDTWYHDAQHSLDCTLAMARLLDGHERSVEPNERVGARRAVLGMVIALFHDAGYVRHHSDKAANGAEYTLSHVRRSGAFLARYLPEIGFGNQASLARRLVHFTGYEIELDQIQVRHPKDRKLGFLVGTADLVAQTSDRCYLEKCRDYLFHEFEICGIAGKPLPGKQAPRYPTVETLLENTPEFNRCLWNERLDGYFGGVHRYFDAHFGGSNPYVAQIREHLKLISRLGSHKQLYKLNKRPQRIAAAELRKLLGITSPPKRRNAARAAPGEAAAQV